MVTASRSPQPEWSVAAHTTVISGEEMERAGIEYVADALRRLSGLAVVRNGSFGAVTSVFVRGGESDHVQVLVDGLAVNEPGGNFDFGSLTTDNVERIEVVRGPLSALYGSDATSGIIHIFTRRGTGQPRWTLSLSRGSFATRRWQGGVSGGTGVLSYAFSLGRNETDGILDFNNDFRQTTGTGRVHGQLDPRTDAVLALRYEDRRFHFPTDGSGTPTDHNAYTFGDALSAHIDAGRRWTESFETRVALILRETDAGTDDTSDHPGDTLGSFGFKSLDDVRRAGAHVRAVWKTGGGTTLATGYEMEQQSVRGFSRSFSQYGTPAASSESERRNRAAYVRFTGIRRGAALNAGLRVEDNDQFGTAATYRVGVVWRSAFGHTRLRASVGTGIKEPTFVETRATGFATGNPDLGPEKSAGFEVGADRELGAARLSLTAFRQRYRDLIQYTASPPVPNGPNFYNVARASSRGLEAEAEVGARGFRFSGRYTWLDTQVEDAGFDEGPGASFVAGQPLLRRPRHAVAGTAFVRLGDRVGLDLDARRVGEREDRDFATYPATPVTLPAYLVVDLAASFEVTGAQGRARVTFTVRGENLFDRSYEEAWGFRVPGRGVYFGGRVAVGGGE